eukprot:scaffold1558_cov403-Prasinococcus_capsulatus_cf.AAC.30
MSHGPNRSARPGADHVIAREPRRWWYWQSTGVSRPRTCGRQAAGVHAAACRHGTPAERARRSPHAGAARPDDAPAGAVRAARRRRWRYLALTAAASSDWLATTGVSMRS